MAIKRIEDLDSEDEVVQEKTGRLIIKKTHEEDVKAVGIRIKGPTKLLNETKKAKKKSIKEKITLLIKDLENITELQLRRKRYLNDILPFIRKELYDIHYIVSTMNPSRTSNSRINI